MFVTSRFISVDIQYKARGSPPPAVAGALFLGSIVLASKEKLSLVAATREASCLQQEFGDFDCVEGSTLAQIVAGHEHCETMFNCFVSTDPTN